MTATVMRMIARVQRLRLVRAFTHYADAHGSAFAQSMTLSGFFSLFAGLFLAFATMATVLRGDRTLTDRTVELVSAAVPGLIDSGDGGAITVDALLDARVATVAAAIGAVSILFTALRWIGVSREGFRAVLGLADLRQQFVLVKLGDLAVAVGIGLLVIVSSVGLVAVSIVAEDWLGISGLGIVFTHIAQFVLDAAIVMLMYRYAGRLRLPWSRLILAATGCALTFQVLKLFATLLFAGVEKNPLLASIATVVVILIWLGITNEVLLFALAIIAVGPTGAHYVQSVAVALEDRDELERLRAARIATQRSTSATTRFGKSAKKLAKRLGR